MRSHDVQNFLSNFFGSGALRSRPPDRDIDMNIGQQVEVYWNLHRKLFSVRDRQTKRVVGHTHRITLSDVLFRVQPAGNRKVRETGVKNVHAYIVGTVCDDIPDNVSAYPNRRVTYNPHRYESFVYLSDEQPVHSAHYVEASQVGVYIW